ncbi:glycoside hydrolase family 95-like protein [Streptomyces sp. WMMC500]|uniref:glycosyl hydrolase family 95 catalytic domain-containing protein n=1 Tax=Streptomyces sp. WMMC500 TaxID=3015154 RepID=UPI0032B15502
MTATGASAALGAAAPAAAGADSAADHAGLPPVRDGMRRGGAWARFLKGQDLVWGRPPRQWYEGPFLGNGFLASTVCLPQFTNEVRFDVQHSEVQDHRPELDAKYGLCRLPIGFLTLTPQGTVTGVDWRLSLWDAELTGRITTTLGTIGLRAYVHAERPVMVVSLEPSRGERKAAWTFTPEPSVSPRQRTNPDPSYVPNPDSRRTSHGDVDLVVQPLLAGGQYVTAHAETERDGARHLYVTVAHSHPDETAETRAVENLRAARARPPSLLRRSHLEWWHGFYPRSFLSVPDQRLQSFYWIQLYKIASATREGAPVMATTGPWLQPTGWPNAWWNLNVQLEYWLINGSNHPELDALTRTVDEHRQVLIDHVPPQFRHDSAGVSRSTDIFARGAQVGIPGQGEPEIGNLTWALHNVWLSYRHSMDDDVLRDVLFPLLRRSVNYYLHFLTEGADGRLHLPTTFSPEYGGAPDCTYDLALLRWGCTALLAAAERLGTDDALAPRWRDVLARLADYAVDENGYMVGAGVPFARSHRHYSHLLQVYPLYEITWEQPDKRELIEKSLNHWIGFTGALQGYSFTGAASLAAGMGRGDDSLHYLDELMAQGFIKPNTMYKEGGGPVIETPLSAAQSLHDMLVQSWGGVIRVFPAVPADWADAVVHDFRTEGAFEVSAVREGGATRWIRVRSLAGEPCRVRHGITGPVEVDGARWRPAGEGPAGEETIELDLPRHGEALIRRRDTRRFEIAPVPISRPADPWGLKAVPPPGETVPVDLSGHADNDGVSYETAMADGDFDGSGFTYPAEQLPPPGDLLWEGLRFTFPAYGNGAANNVTGNGSRLTVPPGRYAGVHLMGAASGGDLTAARLVAGYADGSTAELEFALTDWGRQPLPGNTEVLRTTRRHGASGPNSTKVGIFATVTALDPARELRTLTLPVTTRPQVHLFAVSLERPKP